LFGFSMVQMVRAHTNKLDRHLRDEMLNLYRPFKWTPCFLHKSFEGFLKYARKMSVIIEFEDGCFETGCDQVRKVMNSHFRNGIKKDFSSLSSCSADVTPNGLEEILGTCSHVRKVYLNREVRALLDVAVPAAKANNVVRNNTVLTGEGVTIAVIDTGIHPHPDLGDRIKGFVDLVNNEPDPYDDNGHGTHCAGDVAASGKYAGPAPRANLVGVKVLNKLGSGSLDTVMAGVDWCIKNIAGDSPFKIDIISMSLGSTATQGDDPMVRAVERAWDAGIVVVVAAGNEGPNYGTVASPGISQKVITVGALDDKNSVDRGDDDVASFSSRGFQNVADALNKPDLLAPGVNIVSLRSPNSYLDKLQKSARVENDYFVLSGTSMATPICAGVAALIKQRMPGATPQQVKDMLKMGTDMWKERENAVYGEGYINAERSIP
jgi:serine protease AprX